jgi:NAD(P)H-hydrate repair Nnr-like enzyme with NAD(P)H-hydrate dehydratase domain
MMRNKNNIAKKEKQRFSIRKLSVGAVSVLLGTTIFWGAPDVAHAATAEAGNGTQKINSEETNKQQNNLNQKKVTLGSQPKTESSQ